MAGSRGRAGRIAGWAKQAYNAAHSCNLTTVLAAPFGAAGVWLPERHRDSRGAATPKSAMEGSPWDRRRSRRRGFPTFSRSSSNGLERMPLEVAVIPIDESSHRAATIEE